MRSLPLVMTLAVVVGTTAPSALAAPKDTLVVGQSADITSFDPTELRMGTYVLTHLLYNSLIRIDQNGKPQPELAKSWTRSEDGKSLTLNLVDGVRFHNGKRLTAKDVAFSINYAKDPANGANILPLARLVERIETPDDLTIVLHLTGGSDAAFDLLDLAFIIDSDAPDKVKTLGNGTGPFKLARYEPGQEAVFVRNDAYWRMPPSLKRVTIRIIPDQQSGIMQLRAGSVDFIPSVDRESAEQLKAAGLATGTATAEGRVLDLTLNVRKAPFDKPAVRQAINLALDRTRIAHDVGGPSSLIKCLPWPAYAREVNTAPAEACKQDIEKAKQLIIDSGAQGAHVDIMSRSQSEPQIGAMAQIVQNTLTGIGLNASINEMSEAAYISRFRKGDFQLAAHVFGRAGRGPATIISSAVIFKGTDNLAGITSSQYAQDVSLVTSSPLNPTTLDAFKRINNYLLEENWVLPIATLPVQWAAKPELRDVSFNLDGMPLLERARLAP
ncbi:ABC transporter substrate-binding protein [Brenneria tiliae]|uniref:ABC transporter substrate-binding protein n=1 Tax=Brenneria tiliae TaxID=2914984 RepID=A0ABT0MV57_9GAMM|nr:ABC transporter substrate-binding protein [Brenneria tiliae]MCL2893714.1 ABC transporter substrate-binding protein [Brenneria tiliae]